MFDKREPEVLVIGAACVDIKGQAERGLTTGTSNRGLVRVSPGGAARNIAENLARLNVRTSLMTVVGTDQNAPPDSGRNQQGRRRHHLRARLSRRLLGRVSGSDESNGPSGRSPSTKWPASSASTRPTFTPTAR